MNYKKYTINNYNIHIIKTKKFKTINICINFKRKIDKNDMTIRRLLTDTLVESSKKYPNRRLIEIEIEELYGVSLRCESFKSGNYDIISFKESFLNEKYTEPGMNKRSILFLLQFIFNPDVKNNEFNDYGFDFANRVIKNDIKSISDYPSSYSTKRMFEFMDKKSPISYRDCGYIKDLNKITKKDLYSYYKSVIENDIVDILITGDIDSDNIIEIFKENFISKNKNKEIESHFIEVAKGREKEKIEKAHINQSRLSIGCNVDCDDMFVKQYVMRVYSFILGGSGDSLLFKTVREKNSLCYHISSSYNIISNVVTIGAGIDAKNYKKTVKLIKECMENIKKGEFDEKEIEKAKNIYKNSCIEMQDSPFSIMNNYISHEYLNTDLIDEKTNKIDKVTKDMVIEIANKISINTIYMLEGDSN